MIARPLLFQTLLRSKQVLIVESAFYVQFVFETFFVLNIAVFHTLGLFYKEYFLRRI